jgi:hypothetical protein
MTQAYRPSAIERAFALADIGVAVGDIRIALGREGYDQNYLNSKTLSRQLSERARAARNK